MSSTSADGEGAAGAADTCDEAAIVGARMRRPKTTMKIVRGRKDARIVGLDAILNFVNCGFAICNSEERLTSSVNVVVAPFAARDDETQCYCMRTVGTGNKVIRVVSKV